ncbi:MAG: hypothetical protein PWP64_1587, partial [Candidatus Cloacimonadota bacterium]|nr:hypothetical protein [Candidatus Cloacimonadota bacterium]
MKRVLVILLVIMTLPALATTAQADLLHSFQIQSRSANGMRISFELPEYTISQIEERGQTYQKIQLEGANSNAPTGMPELPFFSTTIAIPATGNVELNLTTRAQDVAANYHPYPAQDMQAESGESFSKNAAFYNSTEIYPAKVAALSEPMILRDLRIITLQVNPFVYDAGRQELVIRQKVDIDLRFTSAESINELPAEPQSLSPSFAKIYESLILNFDDYRDLVMANTPPRYLIIYGNNTDNTFHDALDQYVLWKRQKGADVDLASTASSEAGSSSTSIQAYIRNRYNNPATRPDYVILLGDTSGSFTIPAFTYSSGGTD